MPLSASRFPFLSLFLAGQAAGSRAVAPEGSHHQAPGTSLLGVMEVK